MSVPGETFDPFVERDEPPYAELARMRASGGVFSTPGGLAYVPRYDDCQAVLRDWRTFTNTGGMRDAGVVVPVEEQFLNEMDGPEHARMRKLVAPSLTPAKVAQAEGFTRRVAEELADVALEAGDVDLISGFAEPIPGRVINLLLGVPVEMQQQFKAWVEEIISGPYPRTFRGQNGRAGLRDAYPAFSEYVDGLVAARRDVPDPSDDLLTTLVQAEFDGNRLSDTEIRTTLIFLIIAGNRTTAHTLGNLLVRLVADRSLFERLAGDRSLVPKAIEESLRLDAATQFLTRTCTRATDVAGRTVAAGARVAVGIASANRDERVFAEPETFLVDRPDAPSHLTFGMGAHFCLGAPLARMELVTALGVFLDRVDRAEMVPGASVVRTKEFWTYGVRSLPVRLTARIGS